MESEPAKDLKAGVSRNETENGHVEAETEDVGGGDIVEPFDPKNIRIETKAMTVDLLISRIREDAIDLAPAFQRKAGLWKDQAQSRLVESFLIRIPIPAFYMDATDDDRWEVVDGLQRLTALKRFVLEQALTLRDLEFLRSFEGKTFNDLPRSMQRRILETTVTVFLIQPGTPDEVKFNIFRRINTGGLPLSPQEIRHALNQGPAADLLLRLATTPEFLKATDGGIRDDRMTDRECALRFLAFTSTPYTNYKSQDLDGFLNAQMRSLNKIGDLGPLEARFLRAMNAARRVFGNDAFRKRNSATEARKPINKALFETWSVNLDQLDDAEIATLVDRKDSLGEGFMALMRDGEFDRAVTQGTGDVNKVRVRFERVAALIRRILT